MASTKDEVATLAQVVGAAKAAAPELEGPGPADRWEGQTDNGLRLWAGREAGRPGHTLRWRYHNAFGHLIQNAVRSVKVAGLAALATAVREANTAAVPDHLPARGAASADPVLSRREEIAGDPYPDGRQVFAPPAGQGLTGFGALSSPPPPPLPPEGAPLVPPEAVMVTFGSGDPPAGSVPLLPPPAAGPAADEAAGEWADRDTQDLAEMAFRDAETAAAADTEVPDGQSDPDVEAAADQGYGDGADAGGDAGGDQLSE